MNDRILLRDLRFYGYHGVHPEEQRLGQPFAVDLEAELDLRRAGQRDDLSDTVSYSALSCGRWSKESHGNSWKQSPKRSLAACSEVGA